MSKIIGITAATTIKPESNGGGIKLEAAQVGQTIVVKAVDENGKPTEWEAVDLPEYENPLPEVTENDNGKFLQVVDGAIALVALQDVSKEGM